MEAQLISAFDSGSSGVGSSPGQGHSVASGLGQITLLSQCLSSRRCVNEYR